MPPAPICSRCLGLVSPTWALLQTDTPLTLAASSACGGCSRPSALWRDPPCVWGGQPGFQPAAAVHLNGGGSQAGGRSVLFRTWELHQGAWVGMGFFSGCWWVLWVVGIRYPFFGYGRKRVTVGLYFPSRSCRPRGTLSLALKCAFTCVHATGRCCDVVPMCVCVYVHVCICVCTCLLACVCVCEGFPESTQPYEK